MVSVTDALAWLEAKAPILFLLGGVLYGISSVGMLLVTYTGTSFVGDTTLAAAGKVLVPLGLFGLVPALLERRPYLTRAAAAVAVIPLAGWSLVLVGEVILKPTGIVSEAPAMLALTPWVGFLGLYLAFALFGIAALLADVHPRALGVLLVFYPAMFPVWLTVLSGVPDFGYGLFAMAVYTGLGLTLRTADRTTDAADVPAEPTA